MSHPPVTRPAVLSLRHGNRVSLPRCTSGHSPGASAGAWHVACEPRYCTKWSGRARQRERSSASDGSDVPGYHGSCGCSRSAAAPAALSALQHRRQSLLVPGHLPVQHAQRRPVYRHYFTLAGHVAWIMQAGRAGGGGGRNPEGCASTLVPIARSETADARPCGYATWRQLQHQQQHRQAGRTSCTRVKFRTAELRQNPAPL